MRVSFSARRFLDPNAQPGTGSGTPDPSPGPRPTVPAASTTRLPANVEAEFQTLVTRTGNAEATARSLFDENYRLRRRIRDQKKALEAFETRNPQGSIVLHGEALANYRAYEQLGKPAELKTQLETAKQTATELAAAKVKDARTKAATILKFNPAVLADRLTIDARELEIRTETGSDGKAKDVVYARKAGDANATWEPLETIAARDWKDHLPALKAGAPAGGNGNGGNAAGSDFVSFPDNGGGNGSSGSASLLDSFTKSRAESARAVTNPLQPQGARTGKA